MKRVCSVLLAVFLLAFSFSVPSFAANPKIYMEYSLTSADTLSVKVNVSENPGFIVMRLRVDYTKDALELTEINDCDIFGDDIHTNDLTKNDIYLYWNNPTSDADITHNGRVAELVFKVKSSEKTADIKLSYDYDNFDIINYDLDKVNFEVENLTVDLKTDIESYNAAAEVEQSEISGESSNLSELNGQNQNKSGVWFYAGAAVLLVLIIVAAVMLKKKNSYEKGN